MSDRIEELGPGTDVVMVTFTRRTNLDRYREENDIPFPILVDSDRSAYAAFGLGRGRVARVWGLRSARRYLALIRTGGLRGLAVPQEDTLQLGGDFVVAPDGTLSWGFWSEGPDDRPGVDDLVRAVRDA